MRKFFAALAVFASLTLGLGAADVATAPPADAHLSGCGISFNVNTGASPDFASINGTNNHGGSISMCHYWVRIGCSTTHGGFTYYTVYNSTQWVPPGHFYSRTAHCPSYAPYLGHTGATWGRSKYKCWTC